MRRLLREYYEENYLYYLYFNQCLCFYVNLQDAVAQLLEHKEENPRVIPARFLSD